MNGSLTYAEAKKLYENGELSFRQFSWYEEGHKKFTTKRDEICNYYGITATEFHTCIKNMRNEISKWENTNGTQCITLEDIPKLLNNLKNACISVTAKASDLEKAFLFNAICYSEAWELYLQYPNTELFVKEFIF